MATGQSAAAPHAAAEAVAVEAGAATVRSLLAARPEAPPGLCRVVTRHRVHRPGRAGRDRAFSHVAALEPDLRGSGTVGWVGVTRVRRAGSAGLHSA